MADPHPVNGWLTVDDLLVQAREQLDRLTPAQAHAAQREGAVLIDIRSDLQRSRDGAIPDAKHYSRNVLEWRLDPTSEHRDPVIARRDLRVILICHEGYQSSLAAAIVRRFGIDATDVIGGFGAWRAERLPVVPPALRSVQNPPPAVNPNVLVGEHDQPGN